MTATDAFSNNGLYWTSVLPIAQRLAANKTGVLSGCAVAQQAVADMTIQSAIGVIYIAGARVPVAADASTTIDAADGTFDRYDLISVNTSGAIVYTAGTANATPVPPEIPASNCPLAVIYVAAGVTSIIDAAIYDLRITIWDSEAPVGSVLALLKTLTGTPTIPSNWVECNGQTISDANSVYNGVTIPNLNANGGGTKRFLRGSTTSGTTGGEDTHTLTEAEMPAHTHSYLSQGTGSTGQNAASTQGITAATGSTGGGNAHNTLPSYYEVVWIMRIK